MQAKRDLVLEAQMIINNYIRKEQFEKITAQANVIGEYIKRKQVKAKKEKRKKIINYLLIISIIALINSIVYLAFFSS